MIRLQPSCSRGIRLLAAAALLAFGQTPRAVFAQETKDGPPEVAEKMSEAWSRIVPVADPPDAKFGEWRFGVQDGWLLAERRTGEGEVEWKIVLAKVVGDEPPEIVVDRPPPGGQVRGVRRAADGTVTETTIPRPTGPIPGSLRLSYRDARYFVRDGFATLRCLREPKTGEEPWPKLEAPPRDPKGFGSGMSASRTAILSHYVSNSWINVMAGPQGSMSVAGPRRAPSMAADCLVRLLHVDLREGGPLRTSGNETANVTVGQWFVIDDGDLLVAKRLAGWRLPNELLARARREPAFGAKLATEKLGGSPAPELSGETWFHTEPPPTWQSLRGKPVLLVLFDLRQPSFAPLVPPLLALQEMYGKQGLVIVGVHANAPRDEVEKRLTEQDIMFPVLIDDGKTIERYIVGYSACVLIDRDGKVVSIYSNSLTPPAEIETLLPAE
ncbi:MAG TPA: hypothetical protein VHC22_29005 [Pirellulales bacterium]|nr:hypothetical protein [Pirellulales bacterium]